MRISSVLRTGGIIAAAGVGLAVAYVGLVRPRYLRWGATEDEVYRPLPGDDLVRCPKIEATRAITIKAPAEAVWPWLVQLGQGRGGLYSYDALSNIVGSEMKSVDQIVPELQNLFVGDRINFTPQMGMRVHAMEPDRWLLLFAKVNTETNEEIGADEPLPRAYFANSWVFYLNQVDEGTTRLIVRFRLDYSSSVGNFVIWRVLTEPAHFVMERGMLMGIKKRAEGMALA